MIVEERKIQSLNGYNINMDIYLPETINKIIIALHGFGGDKKSSVIVALAEELSKSDVGVVAFDLPGHGSSEVDGKEFLVKNCINDLLSIEEYVLKRFKKPIGIFATSFGAYITLLRMTKGENNFSNIILRCPAIDMYNIFKNNILDISIDEYKNRGLCTLGYERKIDVYYEYFEELKNNNVNHMLKELNQEVIIIHGTEDNMAPIADSINFENKFKNYIILEKVNGADHRFKKPGELEKIIEISKKHVVGDQGMEVDIKRKVW